eukprot:CAMPEP_0113474196 /NCGR_PEP_ID=MMETSP0014_2-20120614/18453_1 /TAXON_ID=2857 /ORGANISM="Nitzschia sp." /LENGTH=358 /DNA_ID=CAMNT_0000367023 /DNA_START=82 /DNA_END=1158 /DNA_ORIENTATION=- /assembly_acc=CAM_ASM_000159
MTSSITDIAEGGTITWIGDGSEGSVLEVVKSDENGNSETMTAKAATTGTPFNVRCSHGFSPTTSDSMHIFSFQINNLEGNVAVGIVSDTEFKPGWKTKGMFYNGNVTNGGASLITGFGKYVKSGDLVRVVAKKTTSDASSSSDSLDVMFSINDDVLGTAFSVTDPAVLNSNKTFYPCVHVSGSVTFSYAVAELPSAAGLMFNNNKEPEPRSNFLGEWKIESMVKTDGSTVELPTTGHDIVVTMLSSSKTSSNPDRISVKVGNTMSGPIQVEDGSSSSSSASASASVNVKIGPNLMSTMMMPPPELYAIEQTLSVMLPSMEKMTLSTENQTVVMTAAESGSGELILAPYKKVFEPLTKY